MLAAIGEQFSDCVDKADEIVGISVSCRDKDDIIQIWNLDNKLESKATVVQKLEELVPNVKFSVKFYKGEIICTWSFWYCLTNLFIFISAHSLHDAFEGKSNNNNNVYTKKSKQYYNH